MTIEKLDEVFAENQDVEKIEAEEAFSLLGTVIRKAATDKELEKSGVKASMQRAYLLAKSIEDWTGKEDLDQVTVSASLLEQVKKDAEGVDTASIKMSEAMKLIGELLSEGDREETNKTADEEEVVWGADLNLEEDNGQVGWGEA